MSEIHAFEYPLASAKNHPDKTVIRLQNKTVTGDGSLCIAAGPCSVESYESLLAVALELKNIGVTLLRGGAYKPRSSPYSFQGLEKSGIDHLVRVKKQTDLALISEIMDLSQLADFDEVDIIQVGARNMQNFSLLKGLAKLQKPVLLKRGPGNTITEWLLSAEYLLNGGNHQVILCERGIRSFGTETRYTLDLAAVALAKELSHLPVWADPSHGTGVKTLVAPMAKSAVAAGADGLLIELHQSPQEALSDGAHALTPKEFRKLYLQLKKLESFKKEL